MHIDNTTGNILSENPLKNVRIVCGWVHFHRSRKVCENYWSFLNEYCVKTVKKLCNIL